MSTTARLFQELAKLHLIDLASGSVETLTRELGVAEAALQRADFGSSAALLYAIVESPRYTDFNDTLEYQNAEYDLAVALAAGGAYSEALGVTDRILLRGPGAPYFAVAHRRAVDIALETRAYDAVLVRLEALKIGGALPVEAVSERTYLSGRAAYDKGQLDRAEADLATVSRKSRLFSSAIYIRGVIQVRRGQLKLASDAFCEVATGGGAGERDKYAFVVDNRYYGLKDFSRLAIGRIAHEQTEYDDAYYHFFQVPDDSDRLPEALFAAAWSMYQKRELATARDLIKELLKDFQTSPLVPEAELLAGYIELADCKFDEAEKLFNVASSDADRLRSVVASAQASSVLRRDLLTRALGRAVNDSRGPRALPLPPLGDSPEDRILAMLRFDPRLVRLNDALIGLQREAGYAPQVVETWRRLLDRVRSEGAPAPALPEDQRHAAELLASVRRLRAEARRARAELYDARRAGKLSPDAAAQAIPDLERTEVELALLDEKLVAAAGADDARLAAAAPPELGGMVTAELALSEKQATRAEEMAAKFDEASDRLAAGELARLHNDLSRILERARLGRIDSVLGAKRKLEKEIEDITSEKYQPPSIRKAFQAGLIDEDEEYWPPEEERWDDEYEGWK